MADDQKRPLVFLVDDDDIFTDTLRRRLENEDFAVRRAANGEEALQMLEGMFQAGETPDAMFVDISMPDMNGIDLLEKMHADPRIDAIPKAMLSNFARGDDMSWAERLGAKKMINKSSIVPADIPDIVREIMQK